MAGASSEARDCWACAREVEGVSSKCCGGELAKVLSRGMRGDGRGGNRGTNSGG